MNKISYRRHRFLPEIIHTDYDTVVHSLAVGKDVAIPVTPH